MRQLLILGFYCEVYKKEPLCRIYVNDVLLDEFNIPHTPRKDNWTNEMVLDPKQYNRDYFVFISNPSFYKFIEFNDFDSKSLDIRVEIHNNDNNYANGFMNQHTLVMLSQCYLAPVKLWEKFSQIKNRWKLSQHNWHGHSRSILHYYSGNKNYVVDNLALYTDLHFPDINKQKIQQEEYQSLKMYCSNYQNLPCIQGSSNYWVGTSGHFRLTLAKKLGFWRHNTDRRWGWWKWSQSNNVKDLYDKYLQYEDTRSVNT